MVHSSSELILAVLLVGSATLLGLSNLLFAALGVARPRSSAPTCSEMQSSG